MQHLVRFSSAHPVAALAYPVAYRPRDWCINCGGCQSTSPPCGHAGIVALPTVVCRVELLAMLAPLHRQPAMTPYHATLIAVWGRRFLECFVQFFSGVRQAPKSPRLLDLGASALQK